MPFDPAAFKAEQRSAWDRCAAGIEHSYLTQLSAATAEMIRLARLAPGDRVLDLGCGIGLQTLMAAEAVGAGGEAIGIDLSPGVIAEARRAAAARGLHQARFRVMDAEAPDFSDHRFDAVISQWALFIFTDPDRVLKEAARMLRPQGRLAVVVTGDEENCGFLTTPARVAARYGLMPPRSEAAPNNFRFAAVGALEAALHAAGFVEVRAVRRTLTLTARDPATYWQLFLAGAGPFQARFADWPREIRQQVVTEIQREVAADDPAAEVRLPLEVVLAAGQTEPGDSGRKALSRRAKPAPFLNNTERG